MSTEFYPTRPIPFEEFLAKVETDPRFDIQPSQLGIHWKYIHCEELDSGIQVGSYKGLMILEAFGGVRHRQFVMQELAKLLETEFVSQYGTELVLQDRQIDGQALVNPNDFPEEERKRTWNIIDVWLANIYPLYQVTP